MTGPAVDPFATLPLVRRSAVSDPFATLPSVHKSTPSATEQVVGSGEQIYNFFRHPIDAVTGLAHGVRTAFSEGLAAPVQGSTRAESDYLRGKGIDPRPDIPYGGTITAATPGSVTHRDAALGEVNTAANIAAPGFGGAVTKRLVNAGLGALNDREQPIRGATTGLVLGEVLSAPEHLGRLGDVSEGVIEAGAKGVHETVATDAPLWGKNRRPSYTLPLKDRPPVEPGPNAQTVSVGGRVKRRVVAAADALPAKPTEIAEQALNANGQQDAAPDAPQIAERPDLETRSFGGPPAGRLQPVVSSNGAFEARPGVLRKVNRELGSEPITTTPLMDRSGGSTEPIDVREVRSFEGRPATPAEASDILNIAKLNLQDATAEARVANQVEQFRAQREANRQTFAEADVNRAEIVKELTASDPKALNPAAAKRLSGEELLARRDVVRQNDQLIGDLSKAIESKTLSVADHEQAVQLMQKAVEHNDALLSDLVTGSSQKGRDLNLLRRLANSSLDSDVWHVQAKRMLGDRPLTDEISASIRRLSKEALDACR